MNFDKAHEYWMMFRYPLMVFALTVALLILLQLLLSMGVAT